MPGLRTADEWRKLLGLSQQRTASNLESVDDQTDSRERVWRARAALEKLITDRFGGDPALLSAAKDIALTGAQAIDVLEVDDGTEPTMDEYGALEAVTAFDGTRPSFLVKQDEVDFDSSFHAGAWKWDLKPFLSQLGGPISCTGRVERGATHIGTAFLVTPSLAITNRHVAQRIATFAAGEIALKPEVHLDFGREEWNGRQSFDRRAVEAVVFAGASEIVAPIDHHRLDLAVLRVSASTLAGDLGRRHLTTHRVDSAGFSGATHVAAVGYPANPEGFAPVEIQSRFGDVLKRLLEGDGGSKRFAPGAAVESGSIGADVAWSACHDASTINGNSGSPVLVLDAAGVRLAGLHYGGTWGEQRVNWAHLLSTAGPGAGCVAGQTFADFCRAEGIAF